MVKRGKSRRGKERQGEAGIISEARSQAGYRVRKRDNFQSWASLDASISSARCCWTINDRLIESRVTVFRYKESRVWYPLGRMNYDGSATWRLIIEKVSVSASVFYLPSANDALSASNAFVFICVR